MTMLSKGPESEDDDDEPVTVSLTSLSKDAIDIIYYSGLFERKHPSDYQEGCTQWPYLGQSGSGYKCGSRNSLRI